MRMLLDIVPTISVEASKRTFVFEMLIVASLVLIGVAYVALRSNSNRTEGG